MTVSTKDDIIRAAATVARDVAESRLDPATLDQAVADECRELFGAVVGEGDPLWDLHRDVCRQALAAGALTTDELSEWLAVARSRAGEPVTSRQPPFAPSDDTSAASVSPSPEIDLLEPDLSITPKPEAQPDLEPAPDGEGECGCGNNTSMMVELPDGRRIPRRLIAARGRGLPSDDRL